MVKKKNSELNELPAEVVSASIVDGMLIPVIDNKNLSRDLHSKAILNTNKNAYLKAVKAKKERDAKSDELQTLKNDVAELKSMLKQLLGKVD